MASFLRINAITEADRNRVTAEVNDAIGRSGGWITDSYLYSNLSLCLNFEITRGHIRGLVEALRSLDIKISDLSEPSDATISDESEINGTLEITFVHNEPDLKRVVPAIPG